MGHYDVDRSGPSQAEIEARRRAYQKKQAKQVRDAITDGEVRRYLGEVHECHGDGSDCYTEHARDVVYDEADIAAAERLVDRGIYDSVYDVLPVTDRCTQLKRMCFDEGWVRRPTELNPLETYAGDNHPVTEDGLEVMFGGDIERTDDPTWDEEKAQQWYKHD